MHIPKFYFLSVFSLVSIFFCLPMSHTLAVTGENTPEGYVPLTWISEPGITSFMKAPDSVGYIDYITTIDLTKNHIKLMSTSSPRVYEGPAVAPFEDETVKNWRFTRSIVESLKNGNPKAKFIWNAPFFNVEMNTTVLSLGLKSTDAQGDYINSGVRPTPDMEQPRRMLIIDNKTGKAKIADFDADVFVHEGDQAVEGFDPSGSPSSKDVQAERVFLGVRKDGNELVVYCSRSASKREASNALLSANVPVDQQIQVDGGDSATCAYNLPGQYFVEPGRALPHIMGAFAIEAKGTVTINNLNVRTGPGANNPSVRKLALGSMVTIYEEKNGWVRISDKEWVSASYIKKIRTLPYTAKVSIDQLNVRTGAGTNFSVARKLAVNTEVKVLEEKNGWVRIFDTEWVMGQYVK